MAYGTEAEVRVKGGMPITAVGHFDPISGDLDWFFVYWHNSSRQVTRRFYDSLSKRDLEEIETALYEAEVA